MKLEYFTYDMYLKYINNRTNEIYKVQEENEEYNCEEKPNNYHDKLYRDLLSDEQDVVKLLNNFIMQKKKIEDGKLEKYNSSFITKEYKNRESDIVYKIKDTNTFILIEHQSYIDLSMPYRMLEYAVEIIRDTVEKTKMKASKYMYPQVALIVLYTGNDKWNVPIEYKNISDNYLEEGVNIKYNLIDIDEYTKEELIENKCMISKVMAIEKCKTEEELKETLEKLINTTKEANDKEKIRRIIQYILSPIIGKEEAGILLNKLKEGEKSMAGMLETNLRKERMKLIAESEKRGVINVAKEMLKEQIEIEKIAKVTKLKKEEVKQLKEQMAI